MLLCEKYPESGSIHQLTRRRIETEMNWFYFLNLLTSLSEVKAGMNPSLEMILSEYF